MLIPKIINNGEILVRFVFLDDFKKKTIHREKLIDQGVFLDTRQSGISLQRSTYTTEDKCKKLAKKVPNKEYIGFVLFFKKAFGQTVAEFQKERNTFLATLEFTPLDESNNYIINRENININDKGNPAHADILYINPAMSIDEATPNTSLRLFSRKLMLNCKLIIDSNSEGIEFSMGKFSELIAQQDK